MAPFDLELPQFMSTVAPSVASMVPTMVHRLLESNPSVLAALRFVLVGGAAMSDELVDRASDLGVKIIRSYGMTETTSQMATIFSSQGGGAEVLDGVAIEITDPRGLPLPLGSTGLIAVDGRSVSPGYLGDAERTGPLNTTDIGFLHPDRSLVVLGRADDIVVTGGENVSLTKVGCVIAAIDGVSDAVAIGLPDEEWGTSVVAIVATGLARDPLMEASRRVLNPHEFPRQWVLVDRIPMLENGKHDREALRTLGSTGS
jgi:O-succinylbenzoic acid--CoA ligase